MDFLELSFGGRSGYVSVYKIINNSYNLVEEIFFNKTVQEVFANEEETYIMIETFDEMITYFKCPD